jgi:ABC-type phosphate transport system auxiliary subunit
LVRSEVGLGLAEPHRSSVRMAIAQFRVIVEEIERARTDERKDQLDTARLNKIVSGQIEMLERAKIRVQIEKLVTKLSELTKEN